MICRFLIGAAAIAAVASCGTFADDPAGERAFLPDRGIGPWRIAGLEVCLGDMCGEEIWSEIASFDLSHDGRGFIVAAGWRDGHVTLGTLVRLDDGWRVALEPLAEMAATVPWRGGGFVEPDIAATRDGAGAAVVLLGAADGSAIGYARRDADVWVSVATPLVRAADIGVTTVSQPTGVVFDGQALLAFTAIGPNGGDDRILIARGTDTDFASVDATQSALEVALTLTDIDSSRLAPPDPKTGVAPRGWGPLNKLSHPDLGITTDGLLRIFFAATGPIAFGGDLEPTDSNSSIGYAAHGDAIEPGFEPYGQNPIYNRSYGFIFQADELAPSVAGNGDVALLLYMEARASQTLPVIAEHKLGQ